MFKHDGQLTRDYMTEKNIGNLQIKINIQTLIGNRRPLKKKNKMAAITIPLSRVTESQNVCNGLI